MSIRPKWRTTRRDHLVDLLRLSDVDLDGERIEPGVAELGGSLLEVRRIAAADGEGRRAAQALRDRQPEAGAASGDDRDLDP